MWTLCGIGAIVALKYSVYCVIQISETCKPTTPDVLGPYYYPNPPRRRHICDYDATFGDLLVTGWILDELCQPVTGAKIEVWQANRDGHYLFRDKCRGYLFSERNGQYAFLTINPGKYAIDHHKKLFRPAHIHFRVQKPGYKILITQMYFKGDTNLGLNDSCTECSSNHLNLVVAPHDLCPDEMIEHCFDVAHFNIVLQSGDGVNVVKDIDDDSVELVDLVMAGK